MKHERVAELERRIADLKARLPRHSVPPAMLQELESLEEELERLVQESEEDDETGRA
jgi:HAMP domain-containing protein